MSVCIFMDCVTPVTSIADHHERQKYAAVGVEKLKETNTNEFRNLKKKKVLNGTIIFWASQVAQWQRSAGQCRRRGFSAWVYKIPWRRKDFPVAQAVKNLPVKQETREDPLEKEMAIHSSILAWRIPWTEEAGGLPYIRIIFVHFGK